MMAIEPIIRGLLTAHGLKIGPVHRARFASKVEAMLADAPILRVAIEPLLEARNVMRKQRPCWISVSRKWPARIHLQSSGLLEAFYAQPLPGCSPRE
jgi:hypothetical protein